MTSQTIGVPEQKVYVPQNCNGARGQHHLERKANRKAEPTLCEAAEDEAVCDL